MRRRGVYFDPMNTVKSCLPKRLALLALATVLLAIAGSGCNTAHGFGKDVEKAGEKIQDKTE